ncbi:hypothetical protein FEZ51_02040 [Pediococcus stilesii]|uniref:Uncharacterized protein n=1 Tax=Pediococcus stilesii TaxID=331679 RepID=A0A5R9BZK3_9LACO|nr:hypothetical protein [Pediococcus stilesii]TLQ05462.1 hypothetical protein FEZ51_02040 [Pediococcus stilesii]
MFFQIILITLMGLLTLLFSFSLFTISNQLQALHAYLIAKDIVTMDSDQFKELADYAEKIKENKRKQG